MSRRLALIIKKNWKCFWRRMALLNGYGKITFQYIKLDEVAPRKKIFSGTPVTEYVKWYKSELIKK